MLPTLHTGIPLARVVLVLPPLLQRIAAPYLGQQYVAASLLARGHDVACVDLAALGWEGDEDAAVHAILALDPDVVGMTLFTTNALAGYRLAARLRGRALLVAGGPHPTVCPDEPLRFGFDVSIAGEAEHALPEVLAQAGRGPALVRQAWLDDLDALPFPHTSLGCWHAGWYASPVTMATGGVVTSRGCPARCTFCSNQVTGRVARVRSAASVLAELRALTRAHRLRHFAFLDDAFTARRAHVHAICDALLADDELSGVTWSCITPGNMVRPDLLAKMRRAGCVAVNFGLESGDAAVLAAIGKGQRPERVLEAVRAAKAVGMTTVVNFMFGFPEEGPDALDATLDWMDRLADHTDYFNHRGVLVPHPGTPVYDEHVERFGFREWWLDPSRLVPEPDVHGVDDETAMQRLEHDPTLDLDFFRYDEATRDRIAACVRFKARHNRRSAELLARAAS